MTSILMRFLIFPVGLIADIEKAFLQILLAEEDGDVTRFLWMNGINGEVNDNNMQHMRFRRVLFGPSPSPFLMNATIQHHLCTYDEYDWGVVKVKNSLYLNNLISGVEMDEKGSYFYSHAKDVFNAEGMNLRGWKINSTKLRKGFIEDVSEADTKVLGLIWNANEDMLKIFTQRFKI